MEFHTLARRELQALCKKNKIPANTTNAAMAEALKSLQIVEGIEELMQPSQSETTQSSIDSLEGLEITSPYVPPTGGRSTRRRNVLKEELEAVTSVTTTRRTTRRTAAKVSHESQVDTLETPALVSQTSRRNGQMASACQKMDSQLKECIEEEEKKDVSMTPAPLGVTSRRRRVEEGTVQKAYSTRRSVRLAEKNVDVLNDVKSEESELFNNELPTKDSENQEVNLKEGNELSGITGVDAITNMEENYENQEKFEVVSAEELDITHEEDSCIQFAVEVQPAEEISEVVSAEELDMTHEEDSCIQFAIEVQPAEEISEVVSAEELDITHEEDSCIQFAVEVQPAEEISENIEFPGGEDSVEPVNVSEEVKQSEGSVDVCTSMIETTVQNSEELDVEISAGAVEHVLLETKDEIAAKDDAEFCDEVDKEIGTEDVEDLSVTLVKLRLKQEDAQAVSPQRKVADAIEIADSAFTDTESDEMETLELEESEIAADEEQASEVTEQIPTSQGIPPNKYCAVILSDNKENPVSGTKLIIMEERNKADKGSGKSLKELNELSLRKLTKMFKEKLEITKKSSNEALPRAALQVLPENQAKNS